MLGAIINKLVRMCGRKQTAAEKETGPPYVKENPTVFPIGGRWGDRIDWTDNDDDAADTKRVHGWKAPKPEVGDILATPMNSGRVGGYAFVSIRHAESVRDMFFANVRFYGYMEEGK